MKLCPTRNAYGLAVLKCIIKKFLLMSNTQCGLSNMNCVPTCHSMVDLQAVTGDVMVSRCQRSRNLLEQSLREIQNWVPVMLVMQVCQLTCPFSY